MKLPVDIDALLHGRTVGWERLEFKRGWNPLEALHTLCAFANDFHNLGGGYLVLGVEEEDGRPRLPPVGLDPASLDRIHKEVLSLGQAAMRPHYFPVVVPYEIDGRHVLVLWAPGGQTRAYRAKTSLGRDHREYAWFIRKGSSTVRARDDDEAELLSLAATVPFDDRINQRARVDDLSRALIVAFLDEIGSELAADARELPLVDPARQMQLVDGPDEAPFPRNVGLIFFHPEPLRFFPGMQVDVVWFPEGPGGDRFTEKTFRGPLQQMVRDALDYIQRSFLTETVIKHPDRAESTRVANFPLAAIEEAVVNAVYHRSYELREPVEVRIGPEDLVVLSYPGPDRSVSLDQLRAGRALPRRYRNRRIGELLKELDLTEGRGTGIGKILRAMRENGSPEPLFEFDEDYRYFAVTLPAHPAAVDAATSGEERSRTDQVTDQVATLLRAVAGDALSASDLMAHLGLSHRPSFRDGYLHPAIAAGLLEMTLPDRPRSSKQCYRLTASGRAWLAARGDGGHDGR